jgi:alkylation response protein AidB-like acyl-CoA dehydrogenase
MDSRLGRTASAKEKTVTHVARAEFDPIERARSLAPLVREAADEAERERSLPARVAEAMAEAGLYRVAAPREFGGAELDPCTQIRTIEAISEADGSAGWNLMIGIETFGLLAVGFPRGAELFADPKVIVCGSTAAIGRAERAPGGFRLSGRWPFVSGCHNAHYLSLLAAPHENGEPVPGELAQFMIVPRSDWEILDTWNVSGLRGSGSHDVCVEDVFVPVENTASFGRPTVRPTLPIARIPTGTRLAYNKVGVALGIARAAIDGFVELAAGKTPRFSSAKLRERAHVQHAIARAEARVRGARAFVLEAAETVWQAALEDRRSTPHEKALLQLACSDAASGCAEAVDRLAEAAGTSANQLGSPLERHARDVRVIRQHMTVAPQHIDDAGRVLLGLPPEGMMLLMG